MTICYCEPSTASSTRSAHNRRRPRVAARERDDEPRMANAEVARLSETVTNITVKLIWVWVQPLGQRYLLASSLFVQ